jgi:hypothetical protein
MEYYRNIYKARKGEVLMVAGNILSLGSVKKVWNFYEISYLPGQRRVIFPM